MGGNLKVIRFLGPIADRCLQHQDSVVRDQIEPKLLDSSYRGPRYRQCCGLLGRLNILGQSGILPLMGAQAGVKIEDFCAI